VWIFSKNSVFDDHFQLFQIFASSTPEEVRAAPKAEKEEKEDQGAEEDEGQK
jgi:hypothetical protein